MFYVSVVECVLFFVFFFSLFFFLVFYVSVADFFSSDVDVDDMLQLRKKKQFFRHAFAYVCSICACHHFFCPDSET